MTAGIELLTLEDIEDAPEDPIAAFIELANKARDRLESRLQECSSAKDPLGDLKLRHEFMTAVLSVSKELGIEPFASYELPAVDRFDSTVFESFQTELNRCLIHLQWSNRSARRRDSVQLPLAVKEKIRGYLHAIHQQIDKSDLNDSRRSALLRKLREFEEELEKKRVSLAAVARVAFALLTAPGALWASYEVAGKLTTMILQTVGEVKNAEDEHDRLPPVHEPFALAPPRRSVSFQDGDKPDDCE